MVRGFLRILATFALAGAVAAAIVDGARSLAAEALRVTPLGSTLLGLSPKQFGPLFRSLAAPSASFLQQTALWAFYVPTAVALALLALLLYAVARVREPEFDRLMAGR
jgi:hypothetical protein